MAEDFQVTQSNELRLMIILQATGVIHDDVFESRQVPADFKHFVDLFLIFYENDAGFSMCEDKFDLIGSAVDEEADWDGASRLRSQL